MNVKEFLPYVSGHHTFANAMSELFEVIKSKSVTEFKEEVSDFIGCMFLWLKWWWLPLPKSFTNKIITRFKVWHNIFDKNRLIFKNEYLINGSNYNNPKKVEMALSLARKDQYGTGT